MKYSFCFGDLREADFDKIFELNKRCYEKKYLISIENIKKRFNKNSNIFFLIRDIKGRLVGYTSIIPLRNKAYLRIKNGEVDKEVITLDDIIPANEKITDLYFDSIVIDKKYRKNGMGARFSLYVFEQISKLYPEYKRILANTVSEGGLRIAEKRGLNRVRQESDNSIIFEKVMKGKAYVRRKKYKDRDKRIVERKKMKKIIPHLML